MTLAEDWRYFNFTAIAFELTDRCPIGCRSCLRSCGSRNRGVFTLERIARILDNPGSRGSFREIGFSGGEVFLYPELLLAISRYIKLHWGVGISAATNAFWAKSPAVCRSILEPLAECGLRSLLISVDDFHLEYIDLDYIGNCVRTATKELGLKCTLQTITTRSSRRCIDFQRLLDLPAEDPLIAWVENSCDPVGRAALQVPAEELQRSRITEGSLCSVLRLLSVRLDGRVVPCCGSGSEAAGLVIGRLPADDIDQIIEQAGRSPLLNSLAVYGGPYELLGILEKIGYPEYAAGEYTSPCDACFRIFSNREVTAGLNEALKDEWPYFLAARLAFQAKLIEEMRRAK